MPEWSAPIAPHGPGGDHTIHQFKCGLARIGIGRGWKTAAPLFLPIGPPARPPLLAVTPPTRR
ncbi:hypothetical protein, partial [Acetobacter tropicalis]|uniref:hypothetical protein n=1 Tax=Acetobacter tropicalis TaxID=104102 RepID=UPI001B80A9F1